MKVLIGYIILYLVFIVSCIIATIKNYKLEKEIQKSSEKCQKQIGYIHIKIKKLLNNEEIIEDNKIEKLNKHHFHKRQRQLVNKINEIIDYINKE